MAKIAGRARRYWIAGAIRQPDALRHRLGVRTGETIPPGELRAAARGAYGPQTARRARLALTLRSFSHHRRHP